MRKVTAMLLVLAMALTLCACGAEETGAFTILEEIGEKNFAAIYRKGDKLAEVVEAAMASLAASGTLSRISASWLGEDAIILAADAEALSRIEDMPASRSLIIGVDSDSPPYASAQSGTAVGMSVDMAKAIGSLLGWDVRILSIRCDEVETQLASGNIDCALGFAPECVNAENFTVGSTYMRSTIVLAVPEGSEVKSVNKIKGQRVGIPSDPAIEDIVAAHDKLSKRSDGTTVYLTAPRCLEALENGWCAAIAMDERMLEAYAYSFVPQTPAPTE